jgi:hypothetical protein
VSDQVTIPAVLHLSLVVGAPLLDSDGQRLGKVEDLIARIFRLDMTQRLDLDRGPIGVPG